MTTRADLERLALVVHEVRSPTAALAAIAAALRGQRPDDAALRDLLRLAISACRGIDRVVRDAALGQLRPEEVDLAVVVGDAAASAALGGARIRTVVPSQLPVLRVDPLRLRQALDNLVTNAVAHSPAGGEVVVRVQATESDLLVSVEDTGGGIPAAEHERVFEPGVRLADERPGSGLGLAVARAIVEGHGGRLTLESGPGVGSIFTIALPIGRSA